MRSEYVFAAVKEISNRFMLCQVASASARRLQVQAKQPSETINQSLFLIAEARTQRIVPQRYNDTAEADSRPVSLCQPNQVGDNMPGEHVFWNLRVGQ